MAGMDAAWWLNDHLQAWLGEANVADTLTLSAPNNVTSEMGLALLDVADAIRPHPDVVAFLQHVEDDDFLEEMTELPGGREARDAIAAWLDTYGMRCVGEIDITRPRWSERPATLVPVILGNVKNFEPAPPSGASSRGAQEAARRNGKLLERLRALPDGEQKADETKQMIDRVRTFIGYREYPKYGMVSRYFVYKLALLGEAERLVEAGVLARRGRHLLPDVPGAPRSRAHEAGRRRPRSASARRRSSRIRRSHHPGCSPRTARSSTARTGATTCRPARWSACRFPPAPSRGAPASSSTWLRQTRTGRHPGHGVHGPQLVAPVRHRQRPGDRGRGPDDPRRGDRPGVRLASGRRCRSMRRG